MDMDMDMDMEGTSSFIEAVMLDVVYDSTLMVASYAHRQTIRKIFDFILHRPLCAHITTIH